MLYYIVTDLVLCSYTVKRGRRKVMYPTRQEAEALLVDAGKCNPGPWEDHSRVTASLPGNGCREGLCGWSAS